MAATYFDGTYFKKHLFLHNGCTETYLPAREVFHWSLYWRIKIIEMTVANVPTSAFLNHVLSQMRVLPPAPATRIQSSKCTGRAGKGTFYLFSRSFCLKSPLWCLSITDPSLRRPFLLGRCSSLQYWEYPPKWHTKTFSNSCFLSKNYGENNFYHIGRKWKSLPPLQFVTNIEPFALAQICGVRGYIC